jgi:hypothetical protein
LFGEPGWSKENGKVTKATLSLLMSTLLYLVLVPTANSQIIIEGCERAANEDTRVETARAILRVNGRIDPNGKKNVDHYHTVINFWAENGSGEDGVGEDGAVYQESTLSNFTRQEMWDYLDEIFKWSSDMELVVYDELWKTYPDDSMTYMNVNRWFGSTDGGYYEQPGISIVKFRPGEGCASYQRDYFSEGDTWWGISVLREFVRGKRERTISALGLTDRCVDNDGDGYPKYSTSMGCSNTELDCNDYDPDINPGAGNSCQ